MTAIAAVAVFLIIAVLVVAALKSGDFRVSRAARIQAFPEKVFPAINDFRRWGDWSPWEKLDPAMKRTFGGASAGKGAVYEWAGDGQVGSGRMEITESAPPFRVGIKLDFIKPFEGHNAVEFELKAEGGATSVTWTMSGQKNYMMKVMSALRFDVDGMIGGQFEAGLANLKAVAEK